MKKILWSLLVLTTLITACDKNTIEEEQWNHDSFDTLLTQHVDVNGDVNYAAFKTDKAMLEEYIELLKRNAPKDTWSDNKEMAYWINLYNAFTIYNILLEYPVASIMNIESGNIWSTRTVNVGGTDYTLDQIENDKLLRKFNESRVHFAVNCAAASCPPLLNKAWTEANIQQYYASQAKAFINNPAYNLITNNSIEVSKIFEWYATDFGGSTQIVTYIQEYSDTSIDNAATVTYKNYDWTLNEQ
jgi:hypothetical protein